MRNGRLFCEGRKIDAGDVAAGRTESGFQSGNPARSAVFTMSNAAVKLSPYRHQRQS
jgi:hypothetical protein